MTIASYEAEQLRRQRIAEAVIAGDAFEWPAGMRHVRPSRTPTELLLFDVTSDEAFAAYE
ncbi:MAG: hypothetical protein JO019_03550 [Candidatus Kaiserbacteria bacterium]|nr:hypothetical protein [Candidatus Kaiserbacteria bacterium]